MAVSQRSGASTAPLPQTGEQSESVSAVHADGQQPSPPLQALIAVKLQLVAHPEPTIRSRVQASPSLHVLGHEPAPLAIAVSHSSGGSTAPLPQVGEQSESVSALHADGQQPSPPAHIVIGLALQEAEHPEPTRRSSVQASPSSHVLGHAPAPLAIPVSHVSGGSTVPFPHVGEQSPSLCVSHAEGQHPSPLAQSVMGPALQLTAHPDPTNWSFVHAIPSLQVRGHAPASPSGIAVSHASRASTVPFPQVGEQSASVVESQSEGQQPSPSTHALTRLALQLAEHAEPTSRSVVHAIPSSHSLGHAPGSPARMAVSQVSMAPTEPSPQLVEQSLSLAASHPPGQQPSPSTQVTISSQAHAA
jgi:hypothetical protein